MSQVQVLIVVSSPFWIFAHTAPVTLDLLGDVQEVLMACEACNPGRPGDLGRECFDNGDYVAPTTAGFGHSLTEKMVLDARLPGTF